MLSSNNTNTIQFNHNFLGLKDLTEKPSGILRSIRKYSVNGTLPAASISLLTNFALASIAAFMITTDVGIVNILFLPNIKLPFFIVFSVFAGICAVAFALQYMNTQKVDKARIDEKIRGGQDKISQIASEAEKIEIIIPGSKHSIFVPISGTQLGSLEDIKQENTTKVVLLTAPYALSTLVVMGALVSAGFVNIQSGEIFFVFFVLAINVIGACVTLNQLKNNETNHKSNSIQNLGESDAIPFANIFLPFFGKGVVLVMKERCVNKANDPVSKALKILNNFTDKICDILDRQLTQVNTSLDGKLLGPMSEKIDETLEHLKGIKEGLVGSIDGLCKEVSVILSNAKKLTEEVNGLNIKGIAEKVHSTLDTLKKKVENFEVNRLIGYFNSNKQTTSSNSEPKEFLGILGNLTKQLEKVKEEVKEEIMMLKGELQNQSESGYNSSYDDNNDDENLKKLRVNRDNLSKENEKLKLEKQIKILEKENKELKEGHVEQKEQDGWIKAINGEASKFLGYLLQSIELQIKNTQAETKTTLDAFNSQVIIHWKDGSQTICDLNKKVDPQTRFNDVTEIIPTWKEVTVLA
ncbi:MAG: hypothetical protein QWI36_03155 [Wolbachia endosymbiont of Tyrophagus putrescentiae]|nr:hypothetical protein [Wolbachia endosymbiont of Tyrophagus putrescentiae]